MAAFPYYIAIIMLWLLYAITLSSVTRSMKTHCNQHDMNTLLNFKQGVKDPSGLLSSWFSQKDCCQWTGIQCDNTTGRVTKLSLPCHTITPEYGDVDKSHCLTGELNLSLLDIEFLSYLDFKNNNFTAIQYTYSMSSTTCKDLSRDAPFYRCGNSSNLQYLDLSYNDGLPIDNLSWIPGLVSMQYLDLSGIDLHKATDWLQSVTTLPSLSELYLEGCQIQNIYPSLQYANFTSLDVFYLRDNDIISELPSWIFNLSGISVINLSDNQIHGHLPTTLLNLRRIKYLDLSENLLDGPIPDWLGQLEQLQALDLGDNSFFGPIPTSLGNLSALTRLDLSSNNLNGNLPESLGKLLNLKIFRVHDNFLTGNISEIFFHSLTNLEILSFGSPSLIFDFDHEWIPPFQLSHIILEFMVLPKLPSWLYTQNSLKDLTIGHSRVSFEPLDKFWKFAAQLEFFSLFNNSVNADMSNVLLNSKVVWLEDNNLRGGVPQVSPNVTVLNLSFNSLSGSISPFLCHKMKEKTKLKILYIYANNLSGEIPNCWMNWKSLLVVDLGGNNLIGKIPHSMGSLTNVISLDLSNNKLSGEVPISLQNCKNLWVLNLGDNEFSGAIPSWMGQNVKAIILRNNKFNHNIPTEICQLHSLKILDLANNSLLGGIPNCLHNMTSMVSDRALLDVLFIYIHIIDKMKRFGFPLILFIKGLQLPHRNTMYAIDLSSNCLSGTMPLELFMLTRLQSLNLSHNHLVGTIPEEIGNLRQLESLDLSCNRLSGEIPQSMSGMSFLGVLNLSFNNFVGQIPSGTQLQGFTNLSYMGNPQLCGLPLTKNCPQGEKPHQTNPVAEDDNDEAYEVYSWFYMGLGIGFATGFSGVLGVIFFNKRCRHAYFRFLGQLCDMLLLKLNAFYWNIRNCYSGY